jgi:hypothetical protein
MTISCICRCILLAVFVVSPCGCSKISRSYCRIASENTATGEYLHYYVGFDRWGNLAYVCLEQTVFVKYPNEYNWAPVKNQVNIGGDGPSVDGKTVSFTRIPSFYYVSDKIPFRELTLADKEAKQLESLVRGERDKEVLQFVKEVVLPKLGQVPNG